MIVYESINYNHLQVTFRPSIINKDYISTWFCCPLLKKLFLVLNLEECVSRGLSEPGFFFKRTREIFSVPLLWCAGLSEVLSHQWFKVYMETKFRPE